jgi:hypothetical protein
VGDLPGYAALTTLRPTRTESVDHPLLGGHCTVHVGCCVGCRGEMPVRASSDQTVTTLRVTSWVRSVTGRSDLYFLVFLLKSGIVEV